MSRKKDQVFAKLVLQQRLATVDQINEGIQRQRDLRAKGKRVTLSEILIGSGVLSNADAERLEDMNLEPLSCPRCELRYYYPNFDSDATYTCPQCDGALIHERERRITGQIKRGHASSDSAVINSSTVDSGIMPLLDSTSSQSSMIVPTLPRAELGSGIHAIEIRPPEEKEDPLCGQQIGGYRILRKLGQGGMGVIYKAEQLSLNRIVALKMLSKRLAADSHYVNRFIHEARSVARVNNAHIIQIYDVGKEGDHCYFSMEYVQGENVGSIVDRLGKLPVASALPIITQVAEALREAHANGIVHRDIKPDNIILSLNFVAKLADLGIAKTEDLRENFQAGSGIQIGTPYYVSPEQASNPAGVDIRADIYSLGASFFHMITGHYPFTGPTPYVIMHKLAVEPVPYAHEVNSEVPYPVSRLIHTMMEKEPSKRPEHPTALLVLLNELAQELSGRQKQTTSSQRRPLTLQQRELVRIDAPTDSGGLDLRFADEPKKPANTEKHTAARPPAATNNTSSLPPRQRTTASAANLRLPPPTTKPPIALIITIAAAVIGVIALLIGRSMRSRESSESNEQHASSHHAFSSTATSTTVSLGEEATAWAKIERALPIDEQNSAQLDTIAAALTAFIERYPGSTRRSSVEELQHKLTRARQNLAFAPIKLQIDQLTGVKANPPALASAEQLLTQVLSDAQQTAIHELATRELNQLRLASSRRKAELANELDAPRIAESELEQIATATALLMREHRLELEPRLEQLREQLRVTLRNELFAAYLPLVAAVQPLLQARDFAEAANLTGQKLQAPSLAKLDTSSEQADFAALAAAHQALLDGLRQRTKQVKPLRFLDETEARPVELVTVTGNDKLMLATGQPRVLSDLHPEQIDSIIREQQGNLSTAVLATLLLSYGQLEPAWALAQPEATFDPDVRVRLLRRIAAWHLVRVRTLSDAVEIEKLAWLVMHLDQLAHPLQGYPELKPYRAELVKVQGLLQQRVGLASNLIEWATRQRRARRALEWRLLCNAVIRGFPSDAEANTRARELLDQGG